MNRSVPLTLSSAILLKNVHFIPTSMFHKADSSAGPCMFFVVYAPAISILMLGFDDMFTVLSKREYKTYFSFSKDISWKSDAFTLS